MQAVISLHRHYTTFASPCVNELGPLRNYLPFLRSSLVPTSPILVSTRWEVDLLSRAGKE